MTSENDLENHILNSLNNIIFIRPSKVLVGDKLLLIVLVDFKDVINMPHVVLIGTINLKDIFKKLSPLMIKQEKTILKTSYKYINDYENSILIEALAIEEGKKTNFFVLIEKRKDGLVIRVYPEPVIEKTQGVKKILATIAKQIIEEFPMLKIGKTNLQEFL